MRSNSRLTTPPSAPTPVPVPPPKPTHRSTPLQITVLSAEGQPLAGALVCVDKRTPRGREAFYVRLTDEAGTVEPLPLPVGEPDTVFDIFAAVNGYYREAHHSIAVPGELPPYTLMLSPLPEL